MTHSHDSIFNIMPSLLACIKTLDKSSQKYAKQTAYELIGETERKEGKKLNDMSKDEIANIEDWIVDRLY